MISLSFSKWTDITGKGFFTLKEEEEEEEEEVSESQMEGKGRSESDKDNGWKRKKRDKE